MYKIRPSGAFCGVLQAVQYSVQELGIAFYVPAAVTEHIRAGAIEIIQSE